MASWDDLSEAQQGQQLAGAGQFFGGLGQLGGSMYAQNQQQEAAKLGVVNKWGADYLGNMWAGLRSNPYPQAPLGTGSQNAYDTVIRQAMRSQLGAAAGYQGVGGGSAMTRAALQNVAMTQRDATGGLQAAQAQELQQNQLLRAQQQQQYAQLQAYLAQQLLGAKRGGFGSAWGDAMKDQTSGVGFTGVVGGGGQGPGGTYTAVHSGEGRTALTPQQQQAAQQNRPAGVRGPYRPSYSE